MLYHVCTYEFCSLLLYFSSKSLVRSISDLVFFYKRSTPWACPLLGYMIYQIVSQWKVLVREHATSSHMHYVWPYILSLTIYMAICLCLAMDAMSDPWRNSDNVCHVGYVPFHRVYVSSIFLISISSSSQFLFECITIGLVPRLCHVCVICFHFS